MFQVHLYQSLKKALKNQNIMTLVPAPTPPPFSSLSINQESQQTITMWKKWKKEDSSFLATTILAAVSLPFLV